MPPFTRAGNRSAWSRRGWLTIAVGGGSDRGRHRWALDWVGHDGALGELDHQQLGRDLVAVQQDAHLVGEGEIQQAPSRHVDRDRHLVAAVGPLAALAQSFVEDVVGQGTMSPVRSARGTNSLCGTRPCSGCCQRTLLRSGEKRDHLSMVAVGAAAHVGTER